MVTGYTVKLENRASNTELSVNFDTLDEANEYAHKHIHTMENDSFLWEDALVIENTSTTKYFVTP